MQLPTVQTRFLDLPGSFSLRNGAVLAGPIQKTLRGGAIHHVVGQAAGAQHAGGHRHFGTGQAAGRGIDNDIKIGL